MFQLHHTMSLCETSSEISETIQLVHNRTIRSLTSLSLASLFYRYLSLCLSLVTGNCARLLSTLFLSSCWRKPCAAPRVCRGAEQVRARGHVSRVYSFKLLVTCCGRRCVCVLRLLRQIFRLLSLARSPTRRVYSGVPAPLSLSTVT